MIPSQRLPWLALAALCTSVSALAQDADTPQDLTVEERLARLEAENQELKRQMGSVSTELEGFEFRDIIPEVGDSVFGLGPGASKIYQKDQGLSIGGYGEAIYQAFAGDTTAEADFTRAILYVGYKFDDKWVFNSEIEIEHADEIFLEFAYLEYLARPELNFRAGVLLSPMGFINEMHEPTTFRGATRPDTERRIIPSTWRENGLGIVGDAGDFSYRFYAMNGFDGEDFNEAGLRGGRQKASQAKAEDIAFVGRLDWGGVPGLDLGVAAYYGDSGQGNDAIGDAATSIYDAHLQYTTGGLRIRGLYAMSTVDDTEQLFAGNGGTVVGEEMVGWYLEAGYDVMTSLNPDSGQQVIPWARYEEVDTHSKVAAGLTKDPTQDDSNTAFGIDWLPIPNIVFKVAYRDYDQSIDRLELSLGYVF